MFSRKRLVPVAAALAGLLFGLDIGIIAGALPFITTDWQITIKQQEWIVSTMMLGAALGSVCNSWLSSRLGRRSSLLGSGVLFAIGTLGCAFASNIDIMLIFRVIQGFSIGIASYSAPLYLSEMSPKEVRGKRIAMYQVMINSGIVLAFLSDTYFGLSGNWRAMFAVLVIPAALLIFAVMMMPKSPRWLASRGRIAEAKTILHEIRHTDSQAHQEYEDIVDSLKVKQSGFHLFRSNKNFRRSVMLGMTLQFMQQFTGMNILMYYSPTVFKMAGFTTHLEQMISTVLVGLAFVITTAILAPFIDTWGRKPALKIGFAIMGVGMFCLGLLLEVIHNGNHAPVLAYLAVAMAVICIIGYAMSAAPMVWILCSEIQPLKGRDFGISCSTTMNWVANMVLGATFLSLLDGIGTTHTFWLYAGLNIVFILVTILYVPETKGVALEHIEANLMDGVRLRAIGEPEPQAS
ncbi:sugar porter family MFS transporter [Gallaecimonas mangrovi]|uniref:sugar porter family MFS transporter n=1 Tax=Gallaecimonas mangrovi TaxID=2291597 RepID=UPI000E2054F4|nr:sugar porter family MFS transporter [Gallaecimonas mangrovi]